MVLTMLVSSILGGLIGGTLGSQFNDAGSSKTESREDSSSTSLSDATGSNLTITEIVGMNADSVVEILVSGTAQGYFGQMQPVEGAGSGVIFTEDGYIVTNYHVIQGANKVQVTLHNGETYPASIVGGNNDMDIAVIKIKATGLKPAKVGDSSTVQVGDTAVAIGNPLGQLGGTATTGIISALDRNLTIEGRTLSLIQTDAAINGGNSGGGLFNSKGELIGIVDAKSSGVGVEGLAFALPINSVVDDINAIIENGTGGTTRPVVGVTIADVSEDSARYYQLESAGVYITQVTGENAKKAGFQSEDRIVSLDGEEITSSQQFVAAVKKHKAGDIVTIVVSRSGQEIEIKTELEEYTESPL
jgi:serine protease Do